VSALDDRLHVACENSKLFGGCFSGRYWTDDAGLIWTAMFYGGAEVYRFSGKTYEEIDAQINAADKSKWPPSRPECLASDGFGDVCTLPAGHDPAYDHEGRGGSRWRAQ